MHETQIPLMTGSSTLRYSSVLTEAMLSDVYFRPRQPSLFEAENLRVLRMRCRWGFRRIYSTASSLKRHSLSFPERLPYSPRRHRGARARSRYTGGNCVIPMLTELDFAICYSYEGKFATTVASSCSPPASGLRGLVHL